MGNTQSSRFHSIDWLANGPFAPHIDAYKQYLTERGCAASTFSNCMRSIAPLLGCPVNDNGNASTGLEQYRRHRALRPQRLLRPTLPANFRGDCAIAGNAG